MNRVMRTLCAHQAYSIETVVSGKLIEFQKEKLLLSHIFMLITCSSMVLVRQERYERLHHSI